MRVRKHFSLGGCISIWMSNAIFGVFVTPLSLELTQWLWEESLFRLVAFPGAHQWLITSEVLFSLCPWLWQLYWYQQVRIFCIGGPFGRLWSCHPYRYCSGIGHWILCKPCLFLGLDSTLQWNQYLCNIKVLGSISNTFDDMVWYTFIRIFHFWRVLWSCKRNIFIIVVVTVCVLVRIFLFGRVLKSWKLWTCYFTLGVCTGPANKFAITNYWNIEGFKSGLFFPTWLCELFYHQQFWSKYDLTRKSSCMNARGIPPAV